MILKRSESHQPAPYSLRTLDPQFASFFQCFNPVRRLLSVRVGTHNPLSLIVRNLQVSSGGGGPAPYFISISSIS